MALVFSAAAHAELAGARSGSGSSTSSSGRGVFSRSVAVNNAFASCSDEQKQALAKQGCIEHFEMNPEALQHARPCQQGALEYSVTRALTIIPKCSLGVGKAWIDHGKDLLSMLQGAASSVTARLGADSDWQKQVKKCNEAPDLHTKRQMLTQYNLNGWEDDRIHRTSCEDIMSQGVRHQRALIRNNAIREAAAYTARPTEEKQAEFDEAMRKNAERGREAWNSAYNAIQLWMKEKVGIPLACYNAQKNDELICYGVARIVTPDAVAGGAVVGRMRAIAGMTKIEESAAAGTAATRAQVNGVRAMSDENRAAMLSRSSSLDNSGRINQAENLLRDSRPNGLSLEQREALTRAHEVGAERGFGSYTRADLDEKARILREAGFDANERQLLMRTGTAGQEGHSTTVSGASISSGDTAETLLRVPDGIAREKQVEMGARLKELQRSADAENYKKTYQQWQSIDRDYSNRILELQDMRPRPAEYDRHILELRNRQRELKEMYEYYKDYF